MRTLHYTYFLILSLLSFARVKDAFHFSQRIRRRSHSTSGKYPVSESYRESDTITGRDEEGINERFSKQLRNEQKENIAKLGVVALGASISFLFTHDIQSVAATALIASMVASSNDLIGEAVRMVGGTTIDVAKQLIDFDNRNHFSKSIGSLIDNTKVNIDSLPSYFYESYPTIQKPRALPKNAIKIIHSNSKLEYQEAKYETEKIDQDFEIATD